MPLMELGWNIGIRSGTAALLLLPRVVAGHAPQEEKLVGFCLRFLGKKKNELQVLQLMN